MLNLNKIIFSLVCLSGIGIGDALLAKNGPSAPLSIGVTDEIMQLKEELTTVQADAYRSMANSDGYSEEAKDQLYNGLQSSDKVIQKLAKEPHLTDKQKVRAVKQIRKQLRKADKRLHKKNAKEANH